MLHTRRWPRKNGATSRSETKAYSVHLGNAEQAKENKCEADRYAKMLRPILIELRHLK
jgi:hypothetical protein